MTNKFIDGIKFGAGLIFILAIIFGLASAVGFHSANEVLGGTFIGDYTFTGKLILDNSATVCNASSEGAIRYNSLELQLCDGSDWSSVGTSVVIGNDANTVLLLNMDDSSLSDSAVGKAGSNIVSLNGDAQRSSARSKFGGYSSYFDGSGDYLTISDSEDWAFGADDFTIDAWIYPVNTGANMYLLTRGYAGVEGGAEYMLYFLNSDGKIYFNLYFDGYADSENAKVSYTYSANQWQHIAVVRSGTDLMLFIDGSLVDTADVSTKSVRDAATVLYIGEPDSINNYYYSGYIDELRISKVARWTSSFTVPTEAYILG